MTQFQFSPRQPAFKVVVALAAVVAAVAVAVAVVAAVAVAVVAAVAVATVAAAVVVPISMEAGSRVFVERIMVPAKVGNQNGKNGHLQQQTTANNDEFPF